MVEQNECSICGGEVEIEYDECLGRVFRCIECGAIKPVEKPVEDTKRYRRMEQEG